VEEPSTKKQPRVVHNSGEEELYTPPQYIEAARTVLGQIDSDPTSSDNAQETVQAARLYSKDAHDWVGRVWLSRIFEG
jgi:ParB family chromosome partitioning protein